MAFHRFGVASTRCLTWIRTPPAVVPTRGRPRRTMAIISFARNAGARRSPAQSAPRAAWTSAVAHRPVPLQPGSVLLFVQNSSTAAQRANARGEGWLRSSSLSRCAVARQDGQHHDRRRALAKLSGDRPWGTATKFLLVTKLSNGFQLSSLIGCGGFANVCHNRLAVPPPAGGSRQQPTPTLRRAALRPLAAQPVKGLGCETQ